eukprot:gene6777-13731_t
MDNVPNSPKIIGNVPSFQSHSRKKKLKAINGVLAEDLLEGWTQCNYFMNTKKRLCNMGRSPGSLFCGNHRPSDDPAPCRAQRRATSAGMQLERVPCPIDPSHSVYRHDLEVHAKVCNIESRDAMLRAQPYYLQDCNSGNYGKETEINTNNDSTTLAISVDVDILLEKINTCFEKIKNEVPIVNDKRNTNTTSNTTDSNTNTTTDTSHPSSLEVEVETAVLAAVAGTQTTFRKLRHAQQDAQLVSTMIRHGLVRYPRESPSTVLVELGAGRGMLGLAVKAIAPLAPLVLVERSGVRRKADRSLREQQLQFERVRMDIRHLLLWELPALRRNTTDTDTNETGDTDTKTDNPIQIVENQDMLLLPSDTNMDINSSNTPLPPPPSSMMSTTTTTTGKVILMAKHLCGVASDLSLQSILTSSSPSSSSSSESNNFICTPCNTTTTNTPPITKNTINTASTSTSTMSCAGNISRNVVIATCCHHACLWEDYAGREWLASQGIATAQEFDVLRHWSGWAHTLRGRVRTEDGRIVKHRRVTDVNDPTPSTFTATSEGIVQGMEEEEVERGGEVIDMDLQDLNPPVLSMNGGEGEAQEDEDVDEDEEEHGMGIAVVTDDVEEEGDIEPVGKNSSSITTIKSSSSSSLRPAGLGCDDLSRIGWMVKRILDQGRVERLRAAGLHARQVQYCDPSLSPECIVLLASDDPLL